MEEGWEGFWCGQGLEEASDWDDVTEEVVFAVRVSKWDELVIGLAVELRGTGEGSTALAAGAVWATAEVDLGLHAKVFSGNGSAGVVDDGAGLVVIERGGSIKKALSDLCAAAGHLSAEVTAVGHAGDVDDTWGSVNGLKGLDEGIFWLTFGVVGFDSVIVLAADEKVLDCGLVVGAWEAPSVFHVVLEGHLDLVGFDLFVGLMLEFDLEGVGLALGLVWIGVVSAGEVALLERAIVAIVFDEGFLIFGSHVERLFEFGEVREVSGSWVAPRGDRFFACSTAVARWLDASAKTHAKKGREDKNLLIEFHVFSFLTSPLRVIDFKHDKYIG